MNNNPDLYCNRLPYCCPGYYSELKLAHAYVPFQCLNNVYEPMAGLCRGTVFPELYSPYGAEPAYTYDA